MVGAGPCSTLGAGSEHCCGALRSAPHQALTALATAASPLLTSLICQMETSSPRNWMDRVGFALPRSRGRAGSLGARCLRARGSLLPVPAFPVQEGCSCTGRFLSALCVKGQTLTTNIFHQEQTCLGEKTLFCQHLISSGKSVSWARWSGQRSRSLLSCTGRSTHDPACSRARRPGTGVVWDGRAPLHPPSAGCTAPPQHIAFAALPTPPHTCPVLAGWGCAARAGTAAALPAPRHRLLERGGTGQCVLCKTARF